MSNEANWTSQLNIKKSSGTGYTDYRSNPINNRADVTGDFGPGPGAFAVSMAGTNVDFSQFTQPGLAWIRNTGATLLSLGVWDGTEFYGLLELLPGESYVVRVSRLLKHSIGTGSGSASFDGGSYNMRIKSHHAVGAVVVEAFES